MIHVDDIAVGDIMIVKPGQKIAMDGVVLEGASTVNEASITGEPLPVSKKVGDSVFAGTMNEQGSFILRVTKRIEDAEEDIEVTLTTQLFCGDVNLTEVYKNEGYVE